MIDALCLVLAAVLLVGWWLSSALYAQTAGELRAAQDLPTRRHLLDKAGRLVMLSNGCQHTLFFFSIGYLLIKAV